LVDGEDISEYEDQGCCLNCSNAEPGCLCFECQCRKCDQYNSEGYCELAEEYREERYSEMASNIKVVFYKDKWLDVKILGPINKQDYAKIKPFLQQHLKYDYERKSYCYFDVNLRFIPILLMELQKAGFKPQIEGIEET
jgi:hypothetical protein